MFCNQPHRSGGKIQFQIKLETCIWSLDPPCLVANFQWSRVETLLWCWCLGEGGIIYEWRLYQLLGEEASPSQVSLHLRFWYIYIYIWPMLRGQCMSTPRGDIQTLTLARAHSVGHFFVFKSALIDSVNVQSPYLLKSLKTTGHNGLLLVL